MPESKMRRGSVHDLIKDMDKQNGEKERMEKSTSRTLKKLLGGIAEFVIYDNDEPAVEDMEEILMETEAGEINNIVEADDIPDFETKDVFESEPAEPVKVNEKVQNVVVHKNTRKHAAVKFKRMPDTAARVSEEKEVAVTQDFTRTFDKIKKEKGYILGGAKSHTVSPPEEKISPEKVPEEVAPAQISFRYEEHESVNDSYNEENHEEDAAETKKALRAESGGYSTVGLIKRLLLLALGIIAGSTPSPFGMNPFGLALICAADRHIFYIFAGTAISLLFKVENAPVYFISYAVIAVVKLYLRYNKQKSKVQMLGKSASFNRLNREDKTKLINIMRFNDSGMTVISLLLAAVACCIIGIFRFITAQSPAYTDIIYVLLFISITMLFTYLYGGLFEPGADNKILERAGLCALIFTVVYASHSLFIASLSIGYMLSFVIVLIAADLPKKKTQEQADGNGEDEHKETFENRIALNLSDGTSAMSGMTRGALVGLLCGIALGDTAGAVTLGICGLISGLFFNQSSTLAIIAGIISSASYAIYIAGMDAVGYYIPNMAVGITFYFPLARLYERIISKSGAAAVKKAVPFLDRGVLLTELPAEKMKGLSAAFLNLSGTFHELSEKMKYPSQVELKCMIGAVIETRCADCEIFERCVLKNKKERAQAIAEGSALLVKENRLKHDRLQSEFFEKCIMSPEIIKSVNAAFHIRVDENMKSDKMGAFAAQYESVSKLLESCVSRGKEDIAFESDLSEKIYTRLQNIGIEAENVVVIGSRKRTIYIFGIKMSGYSGTIREMLDMFEGICGTCFGEPEYLLKDDYVTMKICSRNKYKILSYQASRAAGEDSGTQEGIKPVNGDSMAYFPGTDGYHYSIISDGMGSGRQAALSSRLTILLMEKLLGSGNKKDLTLEMVNNLLMGKSDESFSSVDMFEADLITGSSVFIKAGAAPSFVIRNSRLFKIQSSTVPAGIISKLNTEQTKFKMECGDYIVMLSDGIISTFEEGGWLLSMITDEKNLANPKKMSENILKTAAVKNPRKDDMSLMIMKIVQADSA